MNLSADLRLTPSPLRSGAGTPVLDEPEDAIRAAVRAATLASLTAPSTADLPFPPPLRTSPQPSTTAGPSSAVPVQPAAAPTPQPAAVPAKKRAAVAATKGPSKRVRLAEQLTRSARARLRAATLSPQPVGRPANPTLGRRRTNPSAVFAPPPRPAVGSPIRQGAADLRAVSRQPKPTSASSAAPVPSPQPQPSTSAVPPPQPQPQPSTSAATLPPSADPNSNHLPHEVLHFAIFLHPNDTAETIATRLAATKGWTDAERLQAVRRVREIQRAVWTQAVYDRMLVPATRNAADIDAYFVALDRRAEAALDRLHHDSNA